MNAEPLASPSAAESAKPRRRRGIKSLALIKDMQALAERWRRRHLTIGMVPTLGALHEGHTALVRAARAECDKVVVSIFVNPLQFGPQEDFEKYPRDVKKDSRLLAAEKADALFAPASGEMYPPGFSTQVMVDQRLTQVLCGLSRPGHFTGVATVVSKLLGIVRPDRLYLGQKDYQQTLVIKRLNADLNLGAGIAVLPTVREADGLAKSSRNAGLSPEERRAAPALFQALKLAEGMLQVGERNPRDVLEAMRKLLKNEPLIVIEYLALKNADTLEDLNVLAGRVLAAAAVKLGNTRLIDNVIVDVPSGGPV